MFIPIDEHIEVNRELHSVRKDGQEIRLTGLEYGLLAYLANQPNRLCPRSEILEKVWGNAFKYDTGTIDVHLNALRRKLGFAKDYPIETIRGAGLIYHINTERPNTCDLQSFVLRWLQSHEPELRSHALVTSVHLTPFVNEITIAPEVLQRMLDANLAALMTTVTAGKLRISSKLSMHHFVFTLDVNGMVSELRIPINGEIEK